MARIPRIYTPQALGDNLTLSLEPSASHHLIKVLRMEVGRALVLFNGDGNEFPATISAIDKKSASVTTQTGTYAPRASNLNISLAIGLSKGDRFDYVLQKATELGVENIMPLFTERSEVRLNKERIEKKIQSWTNIVIGACEQCQRNKIPTLHTPMLFSEYVSACDTQKKYVLHHRTDESLADQTPPESVSLLIGPEGGLSENEITLAEANDFKPLAIGPRVMRTETAPIAAISILQYLWGDF